MRLVAVRVNAGQLDWLPDDPPSHRSALPILDERLRGTKFVALANRSILNAPQQTGMDFWSLNPYVGCEFGCSYCYARYTHRYAVERAHDAGKLSDAEFADFRGAHGWEAFERRVFVKEHALDALERDLRRVKPGETIVIGTATDPYQPAERRFKITRGVLQRLAHCEGLSFGIITKSPLVARDVDVLRRLAARNDLEIYVSLITLDARLVRMLEAPRDATAHTHGSGDTLAAATASALARGAELSDAVAFGKRFITHSVAGSYRLGGGLGPVGHLWRVRDDLA